LSKRLPTPALAEPMSRDPVPDEEFHDWRGGLEGAQDKCAARTEFGVNPGQANADRCCKV
jgi:hypothetical protein